MSSIRRNKLVGGAVAALIVLATSAGYGIVSTQSSPAKSPPAAPSSSRFLQRWTVNAAVLNAGGQYPPTLDLTVGGWVPLTCQIANPKTCSSPGTVSWNLGGGISVPAGKELVIDDVSFYYIGSGVMQGAGSGTGPGGPAGGLMWLAVGVPDQSGHPDVGMGADILMPLQAVNLPFNQSDPNSIPQVAVTGSAHGSWVVLPDDHLYLAGIIMGDFGSLLDAPPVVGFMSVFGHYAAIG